MNCMKQSMMGRWLLAAVALCFVFAGAGTAVGGEKHYLDNGVRASLNYFEKVTLVMEEDRSLNLWEAESIVVQMESQPPSESYGSKGRFRENLDIAEKVILILEENKALTPNSIPGLVRKAEAPPAAAGDIGLGYHKPYVYGEVRGNLSDAERAQLEREERFK